MLGSGHDGISLTRDRIKSRSIRARMVPGRLRMRSSAVNRVRTGEKMSLLEVITQTEADAEAAEEGGADRIEVVADVRAGGLSPDPRTVAGMRRVTSVPMRVMLRA